MKKVFLLATAALLFTGAFADAGKKKSKKCAKGSTCCSKSSKSCCKDKAKTAKL